MAEYRKSSAKSKVETILFSVGHKISLDDISRLSRSKKEEVLAALKELQAEYEQKQSSMMLVDEGDDWKFAVRDHLISVVRKIVTETELTKSVMETLAVIAFKYPILQSDLIKMRTNKAYDHLVELEKSGYITRQKHSRTNLIKLTDKFFRYFDLTQEKLRDQFRDFDSIARAIKEKEIEVDQIRDDQKKKAEELKQQDDKIRQEIESLDKVDEEFKIPLDTYEAKHEPVRQNNENQELKDIGLEIVNLPKESAKKEEKIEVEKELKDNKMEKEPEADKILTSDEKIQIKKPKSKGIQVTPEMEKKVDERVKEIMQDGKNEGQE